MKVAANENCLAEFNELKFKKNHRYIVFRICNEKDKEAIIVERKGEREQTWEHFVSSLPEKEFRYCVFDFEYQNKDHMAISKLIFVNWNPDGAPLKNRVLYATAKQNFKGYLQLNTKDLTLCSRDDMKEQDVIKQLDK